MVLRKFGLRYLVLFAYKFMTLHVHWKWCLIIVLNVIDNIMLSGNQFYRIHDFLC